MRLYQLLEFLVTGIRFDQYYVTGNSSVAVVIDEACGVPPPPIPKLSKSKKQMTNELVYTAVYTKLSSQAGMP